MAFPARRQCKYPWCYFGEDGKPYETQEGLVSQDSVLKDMELHLIMAHTVHGEPVSEAPSEVHPDKPLSLDKGCKLKNLTNCSARKMFTKSLENGNKNADIFFLCL